RFLLRCTDVDPARRPADAAAMAAEFGQVLTAPVEAAGAEPAGDGSPVTIGPYAVREKLGEGSFGILYRGFDESLERDVAIKVLNSSVIGSPQSVERFLREAKASAKLKHENIVSVYQLGQHQGDYYLALEFIAGQSLAAAIPEDGMEPRRAV